MKLNYIKPEISINDIDLECDLATTSSPVTDEEINDPGSKDRGDFEGEGDSGWGALW